MFCTRCGQTNADEARFCQRCGAPFAATTNRLAEPPITFAPPPVADGAPGTALPATVPVAAGEPETDIKAILSLILGFLFFVFPAAVAAVVLGHLSRSDIKKSGGRKQGAGMALAGLILGYVGVAFIPVLIIAAIAIPNLLRAKQAANEASAIATMQRIMAAENNVHAEKNAYTCDANELKDSTARGALTSSAPLHGYTFELSACTAEGYKLLAAPVNASTGRRTYCADEAGAIRGARDRVDVETCLSQGTGSSAR